MSRDERSEKGPMWTCGGMAEGGVVARQGPVAAGAWPIRREARTPSSALSPSFPSPVPDCCQAWAALWESEMFSRS